MTIEDILNSMVPAGQDRFDAGETMAFTRQLEHVQAKLYETKYAPFMGLQLIPAGDSVHPGADTFTWRRFTEIGYAKLIKNYADDLPNVSLYGVEESSNIRGLGESYGYSLQDIRRSTLMGFPLQSAQALAAKRVMMATMDRVLAYGDTSHNIPGFLKNSNVPTVTAITGTWTQGTTTGAAMVADLNKLVHSIPKASKQAHKPDTVALGLDEYEILSGTIMGADAGNTTALEFFLRTNPYISQVVPWAQCDLANASNNGPRAVAYERTAEVVERIVPIEFEQMAAQAKGLSFNVPCHARVGGAVWHYPLAGAYMDGL